MSLHFKKEDVGTLIPRNRYYSPQEIAELKLSGMPFTDRGVRNTVIDNKWQEAGLEFARPRSAKGGGWEYSPKLFPEAAQIDYMRRYYEGLTFHNKEFLDQVAAENAPATEIEFNGLLGDKALDECEAKINILSLWETFRNQYRGTKAQADIEFVAMYNSGQSSFECVQHSCIKSISKPTLKRWLKARNKGGFTKLASQHGGRKGTSLFDVYDDGAIGEAIIGYKTHQPHLTGGHIKDLICADFGRYVIVNGIKRPMPHVRSFERYIANFMEDKKLAILKVTNPDEYRSKGKYVGHNMNSRVVHFNQKWEIDASPTDILTTDGRYTLYALIDIFSRRAMFHISKTPRTDASLALIRRAVMEWGVPVEISTDNGSDFVSAQFKTALKSIGIFQHTCAPFSPEKKGTVERVIGTLNRDLMPTLTGFVGHNVADRKKIEDRKAFSNRLGEKSTDAFDVSVSPERLQEYCNDWAENKYANRKHGTLGMTPLEKQATCNVPITRIKDVRMLDLLLSRITPSRIVGKQGIRVDGELFIGGNLEIGKDVFIRHDPDNAGKIYVYEQDKITFIGEAICAKMYGVDPRELHEEVKAQQAINIKRDVDPILRASRKVKGSDVASKILSQHAEKTTNVTALPKKEVEHNNPSLENAAKAIEGYVPVEKNEVEIVEFKPAKKPKKRGVKEFKADYIRCNKILARIKENKEVSEMDARWAQNYVTSPDYIAEQKMEAFFSA